MNEAELVFTQVLNCSRQDLYLNREMVLDKKNCEYISRVLKQRVSGTPIQYILGKTEFMGMDFKATPGVFIPRPETEILVETAIEVVGSMSEQGAGFKILDMGTGSGCIAVSLAKIFTGAQVVAVDISSAALETAAKNAKLNGVDIDFMQGDLFDIPALQPLLFDLIVCNPAYIPAAQIGSLQREVRFEPRIALDGGSDGLDFYRRIIKDSPAYLKDDGYLILEIGAGQCGAIGKISDASRKFSLVRVTKDYNDIERVVMLKKNGS